MNNLKLLLSQKLTWVFSKNKITLKSNDETIVELKEEKANRASFDLDQNKYVLRSEGFWNPKTIVEKDGRPLLVLKPGFWSTKGTITFENGRVYLCKVRNSPLVKLIFYTAEGKEILFYKLDAQLKPRTILNISENNLDERELLMLIILGGYAFSGIVKENDTSDLIVMVAAGG